MIIVEGNNEGFVLYCRQVCINEKDGKTRFQYKKERILFKFKKNQCNFFFKM